MPYTVQPTLGLTVEDNMSAGVTAATGRLGALADAADKATASTDALNQTVTKAGPSATQLVNRYDEATRAANDLARAKDRLRQAQMTMSAAVESGSKTQEQASAVTDALQAKVRQAQAAVDALSGSLGGGGGEGASKGASLALREFGIQGVQTFSSIAAGQPILMTLVQQGHQVVDIALAQGQGFGALKTAAVGLFDAIGGWTTVGAVAAVGAFAALGIAAEHQESQLRALQDQLRATRSDYDSLAQTVISTSHAFAAQNPVSGSESRAAAQTLASVPTFDGSSAEMQRLLSLSQDLSRVWGTDLPTAAKTLAADLKDPESAALKLAQEGFPGMTAAQVELIKHLQDSGKLIQAQGALYDTLSHQVAGATQNMTPLDEALLDLKKAWDSAAEGPHSFGHAVEVAAASAVLVVADLVKSVKQLWDLLPSFGGHSAPAASGVAAPLPVTQAPVLLGPPIAGTSERAVGMFQVLPSTGRGLGYDVTDPNQNIEAGLTYFAHQYHAKGLDGALAQYGGYGNNVAAAQGYINKFMHANTAQLPQTAADAIQFWGQYLGLPQDLIDAGKVLAVVESGGRQYAAQGSSQLAAGNKQAQGAQAQANLLAANAVSAGTVEAQNKALHDQIDRLTAAQAAVQQGSSDWQKYQQQIDADTAAINQNNLKLQNQFDALSRLNPAYGATVKGILDQTDANIALTAAYDQGYDAIGKTTALIEADKQARAQFPHDTAAYGKALANYTGLYEDQAKSLGDLHLAQQKLQNEDQTKYIQAETGALGMNSDARAELLAHMQAEMTARKEGNGVITDEGQAYIKSVDAMTQAQIAYDHQKQAMDELANAAQSSFSTIGNAIAQAFVQGQGQAVSWGNVMKSVIEQVIQEALKLAVLNPILNSLFGQSNPTLSGVVGALSSVSGAGAGMGGASSGSGSLLSDFGSIAGLGKSALSLSGGVGSGSGSGLFGGLVDDYHSLTALMDTPLWGTATTGAAGPVGSGFLSNGLDFGAAAGTPGDAVAGVGVGPTLGSLASVAGGAYGLYSGIQMGGVGGAIEAGGSAAGLVMAGGAAAAGAGLLGGGIGAAAAAAGPYAPLVIAAAAIIGSLVGGPKKNPYSDYAVTDAGNGLYTESGHVSQLVNDTQSQAQTSSALMTLNEYMLQNGLRAAPSPYTPHIGTNVTGLNQVSDLNAGFAALAFTSPDDAQLANALGGKHFQSLQDLQSFISGYQQLMAEIPQLTQTTTTVHGSLADAIDQVNQKYEAAIAVAQRYGVATDQLTAAQNKAVADLQAAAQSQVAGIEQTLKARLMQDQGDTAGSQLLTFDAQAQQQRDQMTQQLVALFGTAYEQTSDYNRIMGELNQALDLERQQITDAARGQVTNIEQTLRARVLQDQGDTLDSQLVTFDMQAQQQRDQMTQQLVSLFGDSYKQTSEYNYIMSELNQALDLERKHIVDAAKVTVDYTSARQTLAGTVTSLSSYVASLETGGQSALSPQQQYALAQQQFQAVGGAAAAGNYDSLQQLQGYASAFLSTSRTLYGSGAQYANDFQSVLNVLQQAVSQPTDTLTASAYASINQSSTDRVVSVMQSVRDAVNALRAEVQQGAMRPARLAA